MKTITLAKRRIGQDAPVLLVAEIGVNHNGDPGLASELVAAAAEAGADAVKFQTFSADRLVTGLAEKAPYQTVSTRAAGRQFDMLRALEFPKDAYAGILDVCRTRQIEFLSTPYGPEDADFLADLGVPAFKIASAQIVEPSFLVHVARKGKPVLLSTGMATLPEIDHAVHTILSTGNADLVLLQCTTSYPAAIEDANLRVIPMLHDRFTLHVGYSDHTPTAASAIAAVALGAVVIEKHFTLDKTLAGPDHAASADPDEFRRMVDAVREVELALGTATKEPTAQERRNLPYMRRSIVARVAIPAGTRLTADLLTFKRPGLGISPGSLEELLGARTRVDLEPDAVVRWGDIER